MARKKKAQDPNHLGFGRLLAFKSSDVVAAWVNLIALNYLSVYASDTLGISVMTVGTLLLISKIVDAFTDVFAGWLVDNTHTKLGTGRTYEPAIVGMTICTVLLFSASPEWSNFVKCAWIFCMYTFTFSIFATLRWRVSILTRSGTFRIIRSSFVRLHPMAASLRWADPF